MTAAKNTKPIAEALTNEAQKQLDLGKARERQIERLQNGFEEILKTRTQISKLAKQQQNIESKGARSAAQIFGKGTTQEQGLKKVNAELVKARKYLDVLEDTQIDINNRVVEASRAQGQYNAKLREGAKFQERSAAAAADASKQIKKFGQGAFAGAGVAASSAVSQVPVLGGAVTGGLVGGLTAGAPGAIGGAVAGGVADATNQLAAFSAQATKTATDINRLNKSLELAAGADYAQALLIIRRVVDDFNTPLTDASEQFTKLFSSAQGSGLAVGELEDLFVALSAANKAFAGDTEDLNGILRAFAQIISKGTVQSEELKGQVGERLPGAFAMAAESLNMTTVELSKALENGEVKSEEFVRKFGRYMLQFDAKAKTIADSPVEAGARLQTAITDLENEVGRDLASLGADFQDLATVIVRELIPVVKDLIQFAKDLKAVLKPLKDIAVDLGEAMSNAGLGLGDFVRQVIISIPLVRELYLGLRGLVEIGNRLGIGNDKGGVYGGLPNDYKQTERAAFAQAERWANRGNQQNTENPDLSGGSGGKTTKAYQSQADALLNQQKYLENILRLESGRVATTERLAADQDLLMSKLRIELEYQKDLEDLNLDLKQKKLDAIDFELKATNLLLQKKIDLRMIDNEEAQRQFDLARAFEDKVRDLETQIEFEEAITEEKRRQLEYEAALKAIENDGSLSEPEKQKLLGLQDRLNKVREQNANPINQYMKQLNEDLDNTRAMVVSLAQTVETELASAMSSAVTGLITGTKTAQEAFAEMFANIGKAFVDMATQMIAKALVMKALNILLPGASPAAATPTPHSLPGVPQSAANSVGWQGNLNYEGGGYTGMGPRAGGLDGRGGFMAMVHPDETIIDHRSPMGRYSGGNSPSNGGAMTINFQTQMINNVEYVTKDEAMAMSRAAANDGARRGAQSGHARSMQTLQNSRSQRAKLGMS